MPYPTAPEPPDHPAEGRTCQPCGRPAVGWRWWSQHSEWRPACRTHLDVSGLPWRHRSYDLARTEGAGQ